MAITKFTGRHDFLSNFYPCLIYYEAISYPSVEHAYQAAKTDNLDIRRTIARALSPAKAKKLGRCVELRADWELVKIPIMFELL